MAADEAPMQRSVFERHVQSFILALLVGLTLWVGNTLIGLSKSTISTEIKVDALTEKMRATYTASDAARDMRDVSRDMGEVRKRLDELEGFRRRQQK